MDCYTIDNIYQKLHNLNLRSVLKELKEMNYLYTEYQREYGPNWFLKLEILKKHIKYLQQVPLKKNEVYQPWVPLYDISGQNMGYPPVTNPFMATDRHGYEIFFPDNTTICEIMGRVGKYNIVVRFS